MAKVATSPAMPTAGAKHPRSNPTLVLDSRSAIVLTSKMPSFIKFSISLLLYNGYIYESPPLHFTPGRLLRPLISTLLIYSLRDKFATGNLTTVIREILTSFPKFPSGNSMKPRCYFSPQVFYIIKPFASEHDADTPHRIAVGIRADPVGNYRNPYAREK